MASRTNIDRLLERLYSVTDADSFYPNLNRILRDTFSVGSFNVELAGKGDDVYRDWEGLEAGKETQEFPLEIQSEAFGRILITPPFARQNPLFLSFIKHVAISIFMHKTMEQQEQLLEEGVAHVQALESLSHLLSELDAELILNRILKFCIDIAGAEVGAARYIEDGTIEKRIFWGLPEEILGRIESEVDVEGGIQHIEIDTGRECPFTLGGILYLPMSMSGDRSADLILVSGHSFKLDMVSRQILESCLLFGQQALQKALDHDNEVRRQRMDEQMKVAHRIQERLLPEKLPENQHLQMSGLSRPAQVVGGDYYDVLTLDNGDLMVFVADVSGKGVPAALRMSGLRALLRSQGRAGEGPAVTLQRLNQFLCEEEDMQGSFITACCMYFKDDGREVTLASAGHEPTLLHREGHELQWLSEVGGLPLGLRGSEDYTEKTLTLDEGDILLLYSDGAIDARSEEKERYGNKRLLESVSRKTGESADELLKGILEDLESFRGKQPWSDDLTLLAIKKVK